MAAGQSHRLFRDPARALRHGILAAVACALLSGCTGLVVYSTADTQVGTIDPGLLQANRLAFITPSTITGKEEDKQALALAFASVLSERRPDLQLVSLAETLSAINADGLSEHYRDMYDDYRDTGIFRSDILREVGKVTHSRFLIQLKLAEFEQDSAGRWSMLGFRLVETKRAHMRLFFQIWDSVTGRIVWESLHELSMANDTYTERAVTFRDVARRIANDVADLLPGHPPSPLFPEEGE